MTDKEKIRAEIERLKSQLLRGACSSQIAMETRCKDEAYDEVLAILDTLQEEPSKFDTAIQEGDDVRYNEDLGCRVNLSQLKRVAKKEEPVSEDLGKYINELSKQFPEVSFAKLSRIAVRVAKWQKDKMMEKAVIMEAHEEYGELWGDIRRCNTEKGKRYKVIIIKED